MREKERRRLTIVLPLAGSGGHMEEAEHASWEGLAATGTASRLGKRRTVTMATSTPAWAVHDNHGNTLHDQYQHLIHYYYSL